MTDYEAFQLELSLHMKTWRQLEQAQREKAMLTELLRRWMSDEALDNPHAIYVASEAALSQQAEPATPEERAAWIDANVTGSPELIRAMKLRAGCGEQAEPAPAQDEREAFEALQKKLGVVEEYLERDEAFPDRYSWVSIQDRWATWQAAWNARPAQTEQQPVRLPDEVMVLLTHIEDVLPDDGWDLIEAGKWNAVTRLAAPSRRPPKGANKI